VAYYVIDCIRSTYRLGEPECRNLCQRRR